MREIWKLAWKLLVITAVAGFALGITNELTKDIIAAQAPSATEEAALVMPAAASFEIVSEGEGGLDRVFCAYDASGSVIGYVGTITTRGYGGEIVVNVGLGSDGKITAINVGGENFNETVGLGAKVKEAPFMDQFAGTQPPLVLNQDVAAVTAATISSNAVTNAVNDASKHLAALINGETPAAPVEEPQPVTDEEKAVYVMPAAASVELISEGEGGLDKVFCAYDASGSVIGHVGSITTKGYGGEIVVFVGLGTDGAISAIHVGGENFNETVGLGAKVKEAEFVDQFAGTQPPLTLNQDVAAVTAATISSSAVTNAVNDVSAYLAGLMG